MFEYTIKNKFCGYKNTVFRSHLEAHWAAFFDSIGISWDYEPTKIDGWIPDFLLNGQYYVEVKPLSVMKPQKFQEFNKNYSGALEKGHQVLFLGEQPETIYFNSIEWPILGLEYTSSGHTFIYIDLLHNKIFPGGTPIDNKLQKFLSGLSDFVVQDRWREVDPFKGPISLSAVLPQMLYETTGFDPTEANKKTKGDDND